MLINSWLIVGKLWNVWGTVSLQATLSIFKRSVFQWQISSPVVCASYKYIAVFQYSVCMSGWLWTSSCPLSSWVQGACLAYITSIKVVSRSFSEKLDREPEKLDRKMMSTLLKPPTTKVKLCLYETERSVSCEVYVAWALSFLNLPWKAKVYWVGRSATKICWR